MTIKEMVTRALDDRATFPNGWATEVKDFFTAIGSDHLERRQRWIWELRTSTPYNGEEPTTVLCRSRAKAMALMEEDIRVTLVCDSPRFDAADLVREDDGARLGDEISWTVKRKELLA